jgi:5'-methylthioadenosine phosphorylase
MGRTYKVEPRELKLAVIGGSGLYQVTGSRLIAEHSLDTPFGTPSDPVREVEMAGRRIFFLARHGQGHRLTPSEVPYRANIYGLKSLGVTHILAVSAVGIMKEEIKPGDMVVPDQLFDRTTGIRPSTFFGNGVVGHVSFADPFCEELRQSLIAAAGHCGATVHGGGTYICMEGPAFSTRAESAFYRKTLAPAVIGMTAIPEAKLAREAELCYGMLALATDYDCWHETEADVTVEAVLAVLKANTDLAHRIIHQMAQSLPETTQCQELRAAQNAIMTHSSLIPQETKEKLKLLYGAAFHKP